MKIQALLSALIVAYGCLVGMISVDGDTEETKTPADFYERSNNKMISRYQMVASLYNNSIHKPSRFSGMRIEKVLPLRREHISLLQT